MQILDETAVQRTFKRVYAPIQLTAGAHECHAFDGAICGPCIVSQHTGERTTGVRGRTKYGGASHEAGEARRIEETADEGRGMTSFAPTSSCL